MEEVNSAKWIGRKEFFDNPFILDLDKLYYRRFLRQEESKLRTYLKKAHHPVYNTKYTIFTKITGEEWEKYKKEDAEREVTELKEAESQKASNFENLEKKPK